MNFCTQKIEIDDFFVYEKVQWVLYDSSIDKVFCAENSIDKVYSSFLYRKIFKKMNR